MDENKKVDGAGRCCQSAPSGKCNCNTTISQNQETVNDKIQKLIEAELERAGAIHGDKFHSSHEAYAVLKEETEELNDEIRKMVIDGFMRRVWSGVKKDLKPNQISNVDSIKKGVIGLIAEAVQVAAMCEKYLNFLEGEQADENGQPK